MTAASEAYPPPPIPGRVPARERRVSVVTHPEATHHVEHVVGGQFDSPLTARGRQQADAIAAALRTRIDRSSRVAVATSDLQRTRQTATAIGQSLGVDPTLDPRLREKSYGEAGGRPQSWVDARFVPPPTTVTGSVITTARPVPRPGWTWPAGCT